jgi:PAS domain S-box-containing protein
MRPSDLHAAYDPLPIVVWTSPGDSSWDYVNPRWTEFTGRRLQDEVGTGWLDRIHADDLDAVLSRVDEATTAGRPFSLEFRARRADGEYRWLACSGVPLQHDEQPAGYAGCLTDVTDRRALEQRIMKADRAEAIVQLAGGIAHDFNNLLTGIFGHLALLEEQPDLPGEVRDDLGQIQQSADRAASLARQLLSFSRRQMLTPRILDLNRLVSGTVSAIRRMMGSRIQVVPALDPRLDRVLADPGQLEQVLLQLSAAARDSMPEGGTLELFTRTVTLGEGDVARFPGMRHGVYVMLGVRDTGGAASSTLVLESTAGIARQSGGFIDVETEAGRGTTFSLYLPSAESGAPGVDAGEPIRLKYAGTETVLVVEDDLQVRDLARRVLERSGYTVLTASDAEAATAIADRHPGHIHLLITDMFLPRLSGRELAARLGIHRPAIKVLYVSGTSDEAIARHRVLAPGTEFLEKPFSLDSLLRKVRQVLGDPAGAGALT